MLAIREGSRSRIKRAGRRPVSPNSNDFDLETPLPSLLMLKKAATFFPNSQCVVAPSKR